MENCPLCSADCPVRTSDRDWKGDGVKRIYICWDCLICWPPNQPEMRAPYTSSPMAGVGLTDRRT
jgi:hypothetical protein